VVFLCVGPLSAYHANLILTNRTTSEELKVRLLVTVALRNGRFA
jgi:hypothetical protein